MAGDDTLGFLFSRFNPRLEYNKAFDNFIRLFGRQLLVSLLSAMLIKQAKVKQAKLSRDLAKGESRVKAITSFLP